MPAKNKPNPLVRYWQSASRLKKLMTVLGIIIALPILITIGAYARLAIINLQAAGKVTQARQLVEAQSDSTFNDMLSAVQRSGLAKTEIAKSKYDVCYLTHNDAGWTISSWYQKCYIRYVSGFTTSASQQQVQQFAKANALLFGNYQPGGIIGGSPNCDITRLDYRETLRYRHQSTGAPEPINSDCGAPSPLAEFMSIRNPASGIMVRRVYQQSPNDIPGTAHGPQIWVEYQRDYYSQDIGCGVGLFCTAPRQRAALSDAKVFDLAEITNYSY